VIEPYYQEDGITLYNAKCEDVLPQLTERGDLLLTDPPYEGREDLFATKGVVDFLERLIGEYKQAFIFWPCVGRLPGEPEAIHIWHKAIPIHPNSKIGNVAGHQYERILAWGAGKRCEVIREAAIIGNFAACADEFVRHPTQKPIKLVRWCMGKVKEWDVVFDPFAGSGTTLVAAKRFGRKAVGIEMSEEYCQLIVNRLSQKELFGIENGHGT
jgi:site-specific DNA-methyltransferase (adenine-specific)